MWYTHRICNREVSNLESNVLSKLYLLLLYLFFFVQNYPKLEHGTTTFFIFWSLFNILGHRTWQGLSIKLMCGLLYTLSDNDFLKLTKVQWHVCHWNITLAYIKINVKDLVNGFIVIYVWQLFIWKHWLWMRKEGRNGRKGRKKEIRQIWVSESLVFFTHLCSLKTLILSFLRC